MKKLIMSSLLLSCIGLQSCKNDQNKKQADNAKVETEKPLNVQCYQAIYENDIIDLKLNTLKKWKNYRKFSNESCWFSGKNWKSRRGV